MFEKVNPCQPDKVADRIAGANIESCWAYGFEIKKDFYKAATEKVLRRFEPNLFAE